MQCIFSNWWLQTDKVIYFATEPVVPLENYLQNNSDSHNETAISWGLHQVLVRSKKNTSQMLNLIIIIIMVHLVLQNLPHGYRCFTAVDKQHPYWLHISQSEHSHICINLYACLHSSTWTKRTSQNCKNSNKQECLHNLNTFIRYSINVPSQSEYFYTV